MTLIKLFDRLSIVQARKKKYKNDNDLESHTSSMIAIFLVVRSTYILLGKNIR